MFCLIRERAIEFAGMKVDECNWRWYCLGVINGCRPTLPIRPTIRAGLRLKNVRAGSLRGVRVKKCKNLDLGLRLDYVWFMFQLAVNAAGGVIIADSFGAEESSSF